MWCFYTAYLLELKHSKNDDFEDIEVSTPFGLEHKHHVEFNYESGLVGIPDFWVDVATGLGIPPEELKQHNNEFRDVMEFSNHGLQAKPLQEEEEVKLTDLVNHNDDPEETYQIVKKIGEG